MSKHRSFSALLTAAASPIMLAAAMAHAEPLDESPRPEPRPNVLFDFMNTHKEQLMNFSAHNPQTGMLIATLQGDTLYDVATHYLAVTGAEDPLQAAAQLAQENDIPVSEIYTRLPDNQMISVPLPQGTELRSINAMDAETLPDLAIEFNQYGLLPAMLQDDYERTQQMLWSINLELQSPSRMPGPGYDYTYLAPDDFSHIPSLRGPAENTAHAHVFLTENPKDEGGGTQHHELVYEYATHYAHALNPDINLGTINALQLEPENLDYLPTNSEEDRNHHMIFSVSMATPLAEVPGLSNTSTQSFPKYSEGAFTRVRTNHIYFLAAGNDGDKENVNRIAGALNMRLTGTAYVVGATDTFHPGQTARLASYSSINPDFLMPPLPLKDGTVKNGTSFATPMAAVLDAQLMRWYGGTLTQQEIMAAGLMTTDMNVLDKIVDGTVSDSPLLFNTNGAGLPYNEYAGAGMVDPQRWVNTLDIMSSLKTNMQHEAEFIEDQHFLIHESYTAETVNGQTFYNYHVQLEEDMTLDRLTFVLPQEPGKRGVTEIISPSGYIHAVPVSIDESHATMAFATEDVKAGDEIIIRSTQPFTDEAFAMIRGYADGNVIQMTRDHLRAQGQLPEPMTAYVGTQPLDLYEKEQAGIIGQIFAKFKLDL